MKAKELANNGVERAVNPYHALVMALGVCEEDGKTIRIPWTEKRYTWRQVANEMIRLYEEELYGDYQRE